MKTSQLSSEPGSSIDSASLHKLEVSIEQDVSADFFQYYLDENLMRTMSNPGEI